MKNYLATFIIIGTSFISSNALADVKYRIAYEATTDEYAVYMTPDSIPAPDLALTAQVTIKTPRPSNRGNFVVKNIQSSIQGAKWHMHSHANAPIEDPNSNYLSFGMVITGSTTPVFGWEPSVEKKIFTFQALGGCRHGVALLENTDPFAQLPNSQNLNPGNQFTNLGWPSANNYTGNYGGAVDCGTEEVEPVLCPNAERRKAVIEKMEYRYKNIVKRIEQRKQRLQLRLKELASRKESLINYCPQ